MIARSLHGDTAIIVNAELLEHLCSKSGEVPRLKAEGKGVQFVTMYAQRSSSLYLYSYFRRSRYFNLASTSGVAREPTRKELISD